MGRDGKAAGLGTWLIVVPPQTVDQGYFFRCRDSESSADDLGTGRGVVLGRAVATLRSVETHPLAWRIRLVGETRPLQCIFCDDDEARGSNWEAKFFVTKRSIVVIGERNIFQV